MRVSSSSRLLGIGILSSLVLACGKDNTSTTGPVVPPPTSSQWVTRTARGVPDPDLRSVYWSPVDSRFYCGGDLEITMDSPDGAEWELKGINGSGSVVGISSVGSAVISVNSDGRILCETCGAGESVTQYNWSPAAITSNLGLAVAVGTDGHVVTHDGQSLTEHATGVAADFTDITWDGFSYFIVSGSDGVLRRSIDGATWTTFSDTHAGRLRSVAAHGPSIVALGENGQILQSLDRGATWKTVKASNGLQDVIWTGKTFMAVGDRGNVLFPGPMGGWRTVSTGVDETLRAATSGLVLVAVGDDGAIVSSTDGTTWEQRQPGRWLDFEDVIWTGTTFLACANVTSGVMPAYLSKDGITWTPASSVEDSYSIWGFEKAAWSGSRAIVSATAYGAWWNGEHQYARVYASEDLLHWRIVRETHDSYSSWTVIWMNNQFFVVCSDEVLRSSDGDTWVSEPTSAYDLLAGFISVTVQGQTAYGISQDGAIYESTDLTSWRYLHGMNVPGGKMDINWTGSEFLVCGYHATKHVWWSSDLSTWEGTDPNTGFDLMGAASSPERWIVVGRNGTIRTLDR